MYFKMLPHIVVIVNSTFLSFGSTSSSGIMDVFPTYTLSHTQWIQEVSKCMYVCVCMYATENKVFEIE